MTIRAARLTLLTAAALALAIAAPAGAATTVTETEGLALTAGAGLTFADTAASGGHALLVWSNGTAAGRFTTTAARRLVVRARGDQCDGAPRMVVSVDGRRCLTEPADSV